jgi:hypothetical protein
MKIISISGSSKDTGKTSLAVYIIRELSHMGAVKFSVHKTNPYGEEGIFEAGKDSISETDTSKMKQAGASPVYWVNTKPSLLKERLQKVLSLIDKPLLIIESNSVLKYLQPDYSIFIMKPFFEDFKESAWLAMKQADIIIINGKFSSVMEKECREFNKKGKIISTEPDGKEVAYSLILEDMRQKLF